MVTPAPTLSTAPSQAPAPHQVLVRLGGGMTDTLLFAMVEGQARLIDAALTLQEGPDRGIEEGIARVAARSGFPLRPAINGVDGVILDTLTQSLLLIGDRAEEDAHALSTVRGLGVVRYFRIPSVPPRNAERNADWVETVLAAWQFGTIDAVLIDVPDGIAPLWLVQLCNALTATDDAPPLLVIASNPDIASVMPPGARTLVRGSQLPEQLAAALAEVECLRLLPTCAHPPPSIFRRQALVTAIIAGQRATGTTMWYIDIANGVTVIGASATRADVSYEPQMDCGAGAPALLSVMRHDAIERWLPTGVDLPAARRWAIRRAAWPTSILTDPTDRAVAGTLARVLLEREAQTKPLARADTIIAGPGWLRWATPAEMLDIFSDVLAPRKPLHIALDPDDMLAATGLLAHLRPDVAESVYATDALRAIGTVIAVPPASQQQESPLTATMTIAGHAERRNISPDALTCITVPEAGTLALGQAGVAPAEYQIPASECGVLIDTRRRPLTAPRQPAQRSNVSDRLRVAP
jgi:hypothetical protein